MDPDTGDVIDAGGLPEPAGSRWNWRDWYLVALAIGFIGVCLGPSLIGLRTLLSVNALTNYYPWIATSGLQTTGHEGCSGDTIDSVMPGIAHVRTDVFAGHLASWQSVVAGGGPLASIPNLGLLDPLSLPYWVLPLWLAPAFVILFSFLVAVGGTFLFLRLLQLSRPASLLAGLIFSTSGFMVMWTNWPQVRVGALIPLLFWAVERLIQRARAIDIVPVALVVASMLFGGFPVVTGYTLYLVGGYFLVRMVVIHRFRLRAWGKGVALAASGLLLGVLLTMVQLLPFLHFLQADSLAYRSGQALQGLPFSSLITLIAPNAEGLCVTGHPNQAGANSIELVAYVGAVALVLAVLGAAFRLGRTSPVERGPRLYFVLASVVVIALGWGSTSFREVTQHLPIFADNFIGRIRSILGFTLAALAAIGFDWVTVERSRVARTSRGAHSGRNRRDSGRLRWILPAAVCVIAGVIGLLVFWRARRSADLLGYRAEFDHAIGIPLVLVIVAVVLVLVARLRMPWGRTAAFVILPLLVVVQGAQFFHAVLPGDSRSNFYPVTGTQRFLYAHLGDGRFASSGLTMYPATALYYGLRTPTGHFFYSTTWEDLLKKVDPNVMSSPTFADFTPAMNQATIGDQPILDRMGVTYFVLPPSDLAGVDQPLPAVDGSTHVANGVGASCTLPGQALRGITVRLDAPLVPSDLQRGATVHITVARPGRTISSGRYFDTPITGDQEFSIALAGEELSAGTPLTVTVRSTGVAGGMTLATANGSLACAAVSPQADHLRIAYADSGSIIYQRLTALPRIRWASASVVIPNADRRLVALDQGLPGDEVVLDTPGPVASGRPATVTVDTDDGDTITARVTAGGAGYLVVADAMQQPGWSVTVDGRPAPLVPADHGMVAVAVPTGAHVVQFHYRAPGQRIGFVVSVLAAVALVLIVIYDVRRRRRATRGAAEVDDGPKAADAGPGPGWVADGSG